MSTTGPLSPSLRQRLLAAIDQHGIAGVQRACGVSSSVTLTRAACGSRVYAITASAIERGLLTLRSPQESNQAA